MDFHSHSFLLFLWWHAAAKASHSLVFVCSTSVNSFVTGWRVPNSLTYSHILFLTSFVQINISSGPETSLWIEMELTHVCQYTACHLLSPLNYSTLCTTENTISFTAYAKLLHCSYLNKWRVEFQAVPHFFP